MGHGAQITPSGPGTQGLRVAAQRISGSEPDLYVAVLEKQVTVLQGRCDEYIRASITLLGEKYDHESDAKQVTALKRDLSAATKRGEAASRREFYAWVLAIACMILAMAMGHLLAVRGY